MPDSVTVLQGQFEALRAEIAARSAAQAGAIQLAVTAVGALGGLAFATGGDRRLLLLIPIVATFLGLIWLDHAANIFNLGDFIKDRIMPRLKEEAGMDDLPDYETFVRGYERNRLAVIRAFTLPPFLIFVLIPAAAMAVSFEAAHKSWGYWMLFGLDGLLLTIFLLYWLPFARGPRPERRGIPPSAAA